MELTSTPIWKRRLFWPVTILFLLVLIDQVLKIWVKTTFTDGQVRNVIGTWFQLHFIENPGFAFGLKPSDLFHEKVDPKNWDLYDRLGKYFLTGFRLVVSIWGFKYLYSLSKREHIHKGLLLAISIILAGAIGNIIDSVFYGVIFKNGNPDPNGWFQGQVVDMLHFPIFSGHMPTWSPIWKGEPFTFFSPIFNFADSCITVGVAWLILKQRKFFSHLGENKPDAVQSESKVESIENGEDIANLEGANLENESPNNLNPASE